MRESETCVIRPFASHDRDGVNACIYELQAHEREIEPRMKRPEDIVDTYLDEILKQCGEKTGTVLVADFGGKIAGYVCVFAKEPNEDEDEIEYDYGYISDVVVLPAYRAEGLGRKLLEAARDFAVDQGAECLRISVLAGNDRAWSVYRNFGFKDRVVELEMPLQPEPRNQ